jgi:hypothetical protein
MRPKRMRAVLSLIALFSVIAGGVPTPRADAQVAPAPTAAPAVKTPDPTIRYARDVVFTIALGTDPSTDARIAVALATRLKARARTDLGLPVKNAWIVPEGNWGLADYLQQCAQDPHTLGAFIVLPPSSGVATNNWIVLLENTTTVTFSIIVAQCDHSGSPPVADGVAGAPPTSPTPRPGDNASVVWASDPATGKFGRSQIEIFPLAVLTSIYLAFAPQRTYQTTSTVAYPAPNPLPSNGARTNVQTLQGTVLDGQGSGAVQNNVLGAFSGNGLGSTIGAAANPDYHLVHAADDAIGHLLTRQLDVYCKDPSMAGPRGFCSW